MMSDNLEPTNWAEPEDDRHCDEDDCLECSPYTLEDFAP